MSESRVWFITGTSSVLRRALAEEVLAQGERAVKFDATDAATDPQKAAKIIIAAVKGENQSLRLPLGLDAFETIEEKLARVKRKIAPWRERAVATTFDVAAAAA